MGVDIFYHGISFIAVKKTLQNCSEAKIATFKWSIESKMLY